MVHGVVMVPFRATSITISYVHFSLAKLNWDCHVSIYWTWFEGWFMCGCHTSHCPCFILWESCMHLPRLQTNTYQQAIILSVEREWGMWTGFIVIGVSANETCHSVTWFACRWQTWDWSDTNKIIKQHFSVLCHINNANTGMSNSSKTGCKKKQTFNLSLVT